MKRAQPADARQCPGGAWREQTRKLSENFLHRPSTTVLLYCCLSVTNCWTVSWFYSVNVSLFGIIRCNVRLILSMYRRFFIRLAFVVTGQGSVPFTQMS